MAENPARLGIAFCALFALAGGTNAENLQWFSNQYDATTILAYGMQETDYAPVVLSCDVGDETARLFVTHEAPDAEDGQQMNVTLSSAAGQVELSATGQFHEIDDLFHLEAEARLDQKLVRVLSAVGVLEISIEGKTQEIPLAGASEEIGALVAACGAPLGPNDIELRITNRVDVPVVSVLFSERGVNDFDGDTYGNQVLSPGDSTWLVIPMASQRVSSIYERNLTRMQNGIHSRDRKTCVRTTNLLSPNKAQSRSACHYGSWYCAQSYASLTPSSLPVKPVLSGN